MACLAILFSLSSTAAFAGSVSGNTAYNATDTNIQNQTIVGEGENNNVIITNTTNDAPSPTGIFITVLREGPRFSDIAQLDAILFVNTLNTSKSVMQSNIVSGG